MNFPIQVRHEAGVAILGIENPPVNALSREVGIALESAVRGAERDHEVRALVILGEGRTFIAGADIRELQKIAAAERPPLRLDTALAAIENCSKPVVMALHGTTLGGGLELAMAGHYRIALPNTRLGQPEVRLGLIPGAGGTQRLPRLVGMVNAARMCVFGEPIHANQAKEMGLLDQVVESDLRTAAMRFALDKAGPPPRRTKDKEPEPGWTEEVQKAFQAIEQEASGRFPGQRAPLAALEAVKAAAQLPFESGLARERELFEQCLYSEQASAMIYIFFAEREVWRPPDIQRPASPPEVQQAMIFGGTEESRKELLADLRISAASGAAPLALALLPPHPGEAARFLRQVEGSTPRSAILAAVAASPDVDALAAGLSRPAKFLGLHMLPKVLEIIRGHATNDEAITPLLELARRAAKLPVVVRNAPGSVGERLFGTQRGSDQMLHEAHAIVGEGLARAEELDILAVHGYGYPVWKGGPYWYGSRHDVTLA